MASADDRLNALLWVSLADPPRCGYWLARVRLGPGKYGPLCPAAIVRVQTFFEPDETENLMIRSPHYTAYLAGEVVSIWTLLQRSHTAPERIVRLEQEITEDEYRYRLAMLDYAKNYQPSEPTGKPKEAVDWLQCDLAL